MSDNGRWVRFRTQVLPQLQAEPAGSVALGDSPETADARLALVLDGPKRAAAWPAADAHSRMTPPPGAGALWVLTDGAGDPRAVVGVEEVRVGPLYTVDAAFAWENGEGDRTRASWLTAHEDLLLQQGVEDLESEPMLFERFSLVWPTPDTPRWWLPGVRELRGHEPAPDGPRPDLPALAAFEGGDITGVLRFEPEPDDLRPVSLNAGDTRTEELLREAFALRRQADRARR